MYMYLTIYIYIYIYISLLYINKNSTLYSVHVSKLCIYLLVKNGIYPFNDEFRKLLPSG